MKRPLTILATRREIVLSTSYVWPPIAIRDFDWCAVDALTYDIGAAAGRGRTESEAVNALLDKLEEKWD